jgi:hypothetical protein
LFIIILTKYIYPNVLDIENRKVILEEKLEKYEALDLKGFNFSEFKELNSFYNSKELDYKTGKETYKDKDLYDFLNEQFYKKIYKTFDETFYSNSLYN